VSGHEPIAGYLRKLKSWLKVCLWFNPRARRRFLAELGDHLDDAADYHKTCGIGRVEAELLAIEDCGSPAKVARGCAVSALFGKWRQLTRVGTCVIAATAATVLVATSGAGDDSIATRPLTPDCETDRERTASSAGAPHSRSENQIVVAGVWSAEERESFAKVLTRFNRKFGAEASIAAEKDARNIAPKLELRSNRGCPPDVALLPQPGLLKSLARAGHLKSIEKVAGPLVDENYSEHWRRLGSLNDTLYGVWFKAANKSMIWYGRATLDKAGQKAPETWEQLKTLAARLSDRGVVPFSVAGRDGWTLTDWFENVYLRTAGRTKYEQLATHEIPWTHRSVKYALRRLADIFVNEQWLAGGINATLNTSYEKSVHQVFSERPQAAMVYEGDFVATIAAQAHGTAGKNAKSFAFPSINGSEPAIVAGGDVAVLFTDNPVARKLIRFLATREAAEPWAKAGGFVSPNTSLPLDAYADRASRRSAQALRTATDISFDLSDQQPPVFGSSKEQGMWQIFQDYLRDPSDIDLVAQRLENAASSAYG